MRFADLEADADLLQQARNQAGELLAAYPQVAVHRLARWLPRGAALMWA